MFQVRQVLEDLMESPAHVVHVGFQDLLDHVGRKECRVREVRRDHREEEVMQDLQDLQAAQVPAVHFCLDYITHVQATCLSAVANFILGL